VTRLPDEFADLEPFADAWCLETEPERYEARLARSMPELQAFYDAVEPRVADAIDYCDRFPLDAMPEPVVDLMHLLYSFVNVSFPVEVWLRPRVPDSGATSFTCFLEPRP
jgi:hypothetical protein